MVLAITTLCFGAATIWPADGELVEVTAAEAPVFVDDLTVDAGCDEGTTTTLVRSRVSFPNAPSMCIGICASTEEDAGG